MCVCTSHGGTPISKTRAETNRAIAPRGLGNQTKRGRFIRATASQGGGNSEIIRGSLEFIYKSAHN